MSEEKPIGPVENVIRSFVDGYADAPPTFEIAVSGILLTFKRMQRYSDIKAFERAGAEFVLSACENPHPEWDVPESKEDRIAAFTLHYYSAEPTRITIAQAFRIIQNPVLTGEILAAIDMGNRSVLDGEFLKQVESAKKESRQTPS